MRGYCSATLPKTGVKMMSPPAKSLNDPALTKIAQLSSSGSATGNPRNKTALAPGHSLMDWIRLGNSGKDLSGVGGKLLDVSPEQLLQHNTKEDAWIAIHGKVYNVTHYMNFHPGGPDELMRGVGTDATDLFIKIHSWVNYDSILKKCLVGRFVPVRLDANTFQAAAAEAPKKADEKRNGESGSPSGSAGSPGAASGGEPTSGAGGGGGGGPPPRNLHWDWYDQPDCAVMVLYCPDRGPAVRVTLGDIPEGAAVGGVPEERANRQLNVELRSLDRIYRLCLYLEAPVKPALKPQHSADSTKVEIKVVKRTGGQWKRLGAPQLVTQLPLSDEDTPFYPMTVRHRTAVNHNTYLIGLGHADATYASVPVGHHVRVARTVKGAEILRCYTPVAPALAGPPPAGWEATPDLITLMVKSYPEGEMSPWLGAVAEGELVQVSPPTGSFSPQAIVDQGRTRLYLIAAGTGFTPMVSLIAWARRQPASRCDRVCLLFFNRTEKDILWRDQLDKLTQEDKRIRVEHILSEADESWGGRHGRINGEVLRSFLPEAPPEDSKAFVCVCGPLPFTQLTKGLLQVMDYTDQDYHCFLG